jgi:hypothetical protein
LDGKRYFFALFGPLHLERSRGAQRGIESDIVGFTLGRAGLDVTAAFTLGVRARAATAAATTQLIEGGIQLTGIEGLADLNLFTPIPPVSIARIENTLRLRALRTTIRARLLNRGDLAYVFFFYPGSGVPRGLVRARLRPGFHPAAVRCALAAHQG